MTEQPDGSLARAIAEPNTILRATVGSKLHGLNLAGTDDTDLMGICIEPPEYVVGLHHFENWVYRTQPEGMPSGPGDVDSTIYSLRKWCRLALNGNPTILLLLFAPDEHCDILAPHARELRAHPEWFACTRAGKAFLGYLEAQRQRLVGERGQKRVKRPELEVAHGYDTKYAMHMLRLGFQGVEFLETGRITLPMPEPDRQICYETRLGEHDVQEILTCAGQLERRLKDLTDGDSPLPEQPNHAAVNEFLIDTYHDWWAHSWGRVRVTGRARLESV